MGLSTAPQVQATSAAIADADARLLKAWDAAKRRDDKAVVAIVKPLADAGHPQALFWLATLYYNGLSGVTEDAAMAFKLAQKAADAGNADAMATLSTMYLRGDAVPKDKAKSFEWAQRAAATGAATGKAVLAERYALGTGVEKDEAAAFKLNSEAALAGVPRAQLNLGIANFWGQGSGVNHADAMLWWILASRQGMGKATSNLSELRFNLSKEQMDAVKTRAETIQRTYWERPHRYTALYNIQRHQDAAVAQAKAEQVEAVRRSRDPNERLISEIEAKGGHCQGYVHHLRIYLERAYQNGDWSGFHQTLGRAQASGC